MVKVLEESLAVGFGDPAAYLEVRKYPDILSQISGLYDVLW